MLSDYHRIMALVEALRIAKTNTQKIQLIRDAIKDNMAVEHFLAMTLNPRYSYYLSDKEFNAYNPHGFTQLYLDQTEPQSFDMLRRTLWRMDDRALSGEAAKRLLVDIASGRAIPRAVISTILSRQLPGNVGASLVNKAVPGTVFEMNYGGITSYDADNLEKMFGKGPVQVEEKINGMCLFITINGSTVRDVGILTRSGQDVTDAFPRVVHFFEHCAPYAQNMVLQVEARLFKAGRYLDLATANGIFNSVFQSSAGAWDNTGCMLCLDMLDALPYREWEAGSTTVGYGFRYLQMQQVYEDMVTQFDEGWDPGFRLLMPEATTVDSADEARAFAKRIIACGGEGAVAKFVRGTWSNTSRQSWCMKIKNEFTCSLVITDVLPHSKNKNWVGSFIATSHDGEISTKVGSGLNEQTGHELDRKQDRCMFLHKVIEVAAEAISKHNALTFPRVVSIRHDKTKADTGEEVRNAYQDSTGIQTISDVNNC